MRLRSMNTIPGTQGVNHFIIGGEALSLETASSFLRFFNSTRLRISNVYGPTECCVDSALYTVSKDDIHLLQSIPIGKPMANQQIYILDNSSRLLPVGVPGELCISGENVSRGYLNQPELTAERFCPLHPCKNFLLTSQKFLPGGPGGAVFSKSAPPGRRRQKYGK